MGGYTTDELEAARSADLVSVASEMGYTPKRVGHYYTLKEMDSIRIYNNRSWFRWSRQYEKGINGGSQVDFLCVFTGMSIVEAVHWLAQYTGYIDGRCKKVDSRVHSYKNTVISEKHEFVLPEKAESNRQLYRYLCNERRLSKEIVDFYVNSGLIYESKTYHNIVFLGNDKTGITRFASMRGTTDLNGKGFKCDVAGNDKRYGFNTFTVDSRKVHVFEGAIDLMSYADMAGDTEQNMIALGMLSDIPLETFLAENTEITDIVFHLDNDIPGRKATGVLMQKYGMRGYAVKDEPAISEYKDFNEMLQADRISCEKERDYTSQFKK